MAALMLAASGKNPKFSYCDYPDMSKNIKNQQDEPQQSLGLTIKNFHILDKLYIFKTDSEEIPKWFIFW